MRFLLSVIASGEGRATPEEMAAIDVFNERLQADGHWVLAAGVDEPERSTVIDNRGADVVVTAGPFVASDEHVAGFWIIDTPDRDTALELAAAGSKACNRKVEVRAFLG